MAQATVSQTENKRSLPAWMLKASSVTEVPKTEDRNNQALQSNVKIGVVDLTNPVKRRTGSRLRNADSEDASELVVLQRCQGREKARGKSKGVVQAEVEEIRDLTTKKGRKASEGAASKNNRKRKLENIQSEASSPVQTDDDTELTVEDLVSIAKEYVNADKQQQHELKAMKTSIHEENFPCPTVLPESDMSQCTTAPRNTRSNKHGGDENKSYQGLRCSSSYETTEDVAQDMLSLFLGPLWSKPTGNAKNSEPAESITRTLNNHVPEETDWHSEVPTQKEPVKKSMLVGSTTMATNHVPEKKDWRSELPKVGEPITKKKSSLRDKVALFL